MRRIAKLWDSFAFHPSALIVLVFERYKRETHSWKTSKELEKTIQVYQNAKDRLPPRNIPGKRQSNWMSHLAYALKVRECPQVLFLFENRIVYRDRGILYASRQGISGENYLVNINKEIGLKHGAAVNHRTPTKENIQETFTQFEA
ncbi:hypothetical protein V6N13_002770 [Hibiscus sabdariffa]